MIVHLLEFRVVPGHDAEVAAYLRGFPHGNGHSPDLPAACTGHRLRRHRSEYVLASVWADAAVYRRNVDSSGVPNYLQPKVELLSGLTSSAFEVLVSRWDHGFAGSKVLRIYRGAVEPSGVELWRSRTQETAGTLTETSGLRALLAGTAGPGTGADTGAPTTPIPVMAVSGWVDWATVLTATGGHIDRLVLDTELVGLEQPDGVDHYQLVDLESNPARTEVASVRP